MHLSRRSLVAGATAGALALGLPGSSRACTPPVLIEFGFDLPEVVYLPAKIAQMEGVAPWFDGVVLDLWQNQGVTGLRQGTQYHMAWTCFGYGRLIDYKNTSQPLAYGKSYNALLATPFQRYKHNLLKVTTQYGAAELFSPIYENYTIPNMRTIAQIAKETGCIGLFFDNEEYNGRPFNYAYQKALAPSPRTFADYQARARFLGQQIMTAWQSVFPALEVVVAFGYWKPWKHVTPSMPLETVSYNLVPALLDGMLDVTKTVIYDGYEESYGFKHLAQFEAFPCQLHAATWAASPKYHTHYKPSFGLWLDYGRKWSNTDLAQNYFQPWMWQQSVTAAMQTTSKYVWLYSEKPNWYDGTMPQGYKDAMSAARASR